MCNCARLANRLCACLGACMDTLTIVAIVATLLARSMVRVRGSPR